LSPGRRAELVYLPLGSLDMVVRSPGRGR